MNPKFSTRTNWSLEPTPYARALEALRADGGELFDLTASNPTSCGLHYDSAGILRELSRPACLRYEPDPRGILAARQAVAQYYADQARTSVDPDRIFLTASTSEAYSYLFRLHCDPGAEVLVAEPSYPLLEFLAGIEDLRLISYPLFYDHGWHLDRAALESRITSRTRAIVAVHPNNPTGHFTSAPDRGELERICDRHGLALIVDEVFLDYSIPDHVGCGAGSGARGSSRRAQSFAAGPHSVPTYVLSGLSKIAGLPQMKAAWIAAFGPEAPLGEALARLEVVADTFLSVNAPMQHTLPYLLANREPIQRQIRSRVQGNLAELDCQLAGAPALSRLAVEAGWCAILRVPALMSGEQLALRLLEERRVAVHPGYFYGFGGDGWLVVSLLPPPIEFAEGIGRILDFPR